MINVIVGILMISFFFSGLGTLSGYLILDIDYLLELSYYCFILSGVFALATAITMFYINYQLEGLQTNQNVSKSF